MVKAFVLPLGVTPGETRRDGDRVLRDGERLAGVAAVRVRHGEVCAATDGSELSDTVIEVEESHVSLTLAPSSVTWAPLLKPVPVMVKLRVLPHAIVDGLIAVTLIARLLNCDVGGIAVAVRVGHDDGPGADRQRAAAGSEADRDGGRGDRGKCRRSCPRCSRSTRWNRSGSPSPRWSGSLSYRS